MYCIAILQLINFLQDHHDPWHDQRADSNIDVDSLIQKASYMGRQQLRNVGYNLKPKMDIR